MMKHTIYLICMMLLVSYSAWAQDGERTMRLLDGYSTTPVAGARLVDQKGQLIATTDAAGNTSLPSSAFDKGYLIAIASGYQPDTLLRYSAIVYLQKLSAILEEAVVSSARVRRLLQRPQEYVVDYTFTGNRILAATYSGNGGRNAKLFVLKNDGDEVATTEVPYEPQSLFKSCVGRYYCVCNDRFYPLTIEDRSLSLTRPYDISLLSGLQQCECSAAGNYYYRIANKSLFRMLYGVIRKGDSIMKPITHFEENDVLLASMQETQDILALLSYGNFREAARRQLLQKKWDYGSYSHIDMPLFVCGDTVVIFDFFKKCIRYYDLTGTPTGTCPIAFEWRQSQQFEVLQDDVSGLLYIHRYGNQSRQTVELLNIHNGTTGSKLALFKPMAERVKMHNGNIYFLWQQSGSTRQLFVQQTDL